MLDYCLDSLGIVSCPHTFKALKRLSRMAHLLYYAGYTEQPLVPKTLSKKEAALMLGFNNIINEHLLNEIFRYASYLGLITNLVISPFHIEFSFNPFHKRDLFFTNMKLQIREFNKQNVL